MSKKNKQFLKVGDVIVRDFEWLSATQTHVDVHNSEGIRRFVIRIDAQYMPYLEILAQVWTTPQADADAQPDRLRHYRTVDVYDNRLPTRDVIPSFVKREMKQFITNYEPQYDAPEYDLMEALTGSPVEKVEELEKRIQLQLKDASA